VNPRQLWSRTFMMAGSLAMLIGALDFMEGSLLILPGSALVALGTYLARRDRQEINFRVGVFLLIAVGIAALVGLSLLGEPVVLSVGVGVRLLPFVPYLAGWSLGIWGPGSPRWMLWAGAAAGVWCLTLFVFILRSLVQAAPAQAVRSDSLALGILIGIVGLATIAGCVLRLRGGLKARVAGQGFQR
jgi:hypothetical protein